MAKLEVVDGKVVITYPEDMYMAGPEEEIYTPEFPIGPDPEEERRSGIGSLLGAVTGAGKSIATLLGRAGQQRSDDQPNFFRDLFLNRAGGGGKDYMIPERAADFKKYYKEDGGFGSLDAPEGVNIFTSAEQAKKMNLDIAKELEAERILPSG